MLRSLAKQTDDKSEILIADHGSTDGTLDFLIENRCLLPRLRLFSVPDRIENECADSLIPDNVLFREAKGDWFLHCDDDGFLSTHVVAFAKRLATWYGGSFFGAIRFIHPETHQLLSADYPSRTPTLDNPPILPIDANHACSALYLVPMSVIREIGGHDMTFRGLGRGVDSRLGYRLAHYGIKTWFVVCPQFTFSHFGLSHVMEHDKAEDFDWKYNNCLVPHLGNSVNPVIANGGQSFWNKFPIQYREISPA